MVDVVEAVGGADQRVAVRGVGDRAVDHPPDPGRAEDRHACERVLDVRLETVEVVVEQLMPKASGSPVQCACSPLVGPEDEAVAFLAQVVADVRVAHQRQEAAVGLDLGDRLGHQVLVLQRHDRQVRARPCGRPRRARYPAALTTISQVMSPGAVAIRHSPDGCARSRLVRGGRSRRRRPGALGERLGDLRRVDVAVVRVPQPADDVVGLEEGVALTISAGVRISNAMPCAAAISATWRNSSTRSAYARGGCCRVTWSIGVATSAGDAGRAELLWACSFMTLKLVEKFGQLPAACQVEPEVSSSRSSSTTSLQPIGSGGRARCSRRCRRRSPPPAHASSWPPPPSHLISAIGRFPASAERWGLRRVTAQPGVPVSGAGRLVEEGAR